MRDLHTKALRYETLIGCAPQPNGDSSGCNPAPIAEVWRPPADSPAKVSARMAASSSRSQPIEKAISQIPCEIYFPKPQIPPVCALAFAGSTRRMNLWRNLPMTRACVSMLFPRAKPRAWAGRGAVRNCFTTDEEFNLQIDGHTRFIEGWDEVLIGMLAQTDSHPNPSLPPIQRALCRESRFLREVLTQSMFLIFAKTAHGTNSPPYLKNPESLSHPVPARSLAGGFYFTLGAHCREVPYDPSIYFSDENSMAVRSFTHGYDLFHPHRHILWHHYGRESAPRHWADHTEEARRSGAVQHFWWLREWRSVLQHQQLFGQADYGIAIRHGFGNQRSVGRFRKIRRVRLPRAQTSFSDTRGSYRLPFLTKMRKVGTSQ